MTNFSKLNGYYNDNNEWSRLDRPEGLLEFELSMHHMKRHLKPESAILDLGCGPGRYSLALASEGHQISAAEPSLELLDVAQRKLSESDYTQNITSVQQANALDLSSYDDLEFDSVVALGPFYHLTESDERLVAAKEVSRVVKTDGLVFAAFIPRLSGLSHMITRAAISPEQVSSQTFRKVFETGVFENNSNSGFQEAYFSSHSDIKDLFKMSGFHHVESVAVQGFSTGKENELYSLKVSDPDLFDVIMDTLKESGSDEHIIANSGHCIYIGQKL
jgi:S-adenosylmethionine-dependent methyltransferase